MPSRSADTENGADRLAATDVAVVGGGAAGLHVALEAAEGGARVTLISRKPLAGSASFWAQGGLAAALRPDDSPERHAEDTLNAGRGACRRSAVEVLSRESPAAVRVLQARGVKFDTEPDGELALGLEGGHSARRIVHAHGAETGRAITSALAALVDADQRIHVVDESSVVALWGDQDGCFGVITDNGTLQASATVLATGGGAALWQRTTNPWGAIGAGAVLAHAVGAELADLEFCQFHPTAMHLPGSEHDGKLVTEAVRGEGALLLDARGSRFTDELAPRDQVSAAILDQMAAEGSECVWLDLRPLPGDRFPSVFAAIRAAGLEPASDPVPVSPAAHYLVGGIVTDLDARTNVPRLYAVGECACTGVHGANRLASNSLSECFVFGSRAARAAVLEPPSPAAPPPGDWRFTPPPLETRAAVWRHAGPKRDADSLTKLLDDPYPLARMVAESALAREESRGTHRRTDFPGQDPGLDRMHLLQAVGADATTPVRW